MPIEIAEAEIEPGIHLTSRVVHYVVHGRTLDELRDEMARIGPISRGGRRPVDAKGKMNLRYPRERGAGSCTTGPLRFELEIVYTYPAWLPCGAVAPEVVIEWNRWLRGLEARAEGGRNLAIDAARRFATELAAVPAAPTCEELDRAVRTVSARFQRKMAAAFKTYERRQRGSAIDAVLRGRRP